MYGTVPVNHQPRVRSIHHSRRSRWFRIARSGACFEFGQGGVWRGCRWWTELLSKRMRSRRACVCVCCAGMDSRRWSAEGSPFITGSRPRLPGSGLRRMCTLHCLWWTQSPAHLLCPRVPISYSCGHITALIWDGGCHLCSCDVGLRDPKNPKTPNPKPIEPKTLKP